MRKSSIGHYNMHSTYNQFLKKFRDHLNDVAEFEGSPDTTMEVITESLNQAGLKEICEGFDSGKDNRTPVQDGGVTETKRKKTSKKETKAKDDDESKSGGGGGGGGGGAKGKRVTAYNIYVAEQVKVNKSTMKDAAAAWKGMTDEEKAPYVKKAQTANTSS